MMLAVPMRRAAALCAPLSRALARPPAGPGCCLRGRRPFATNPLVAAEKLYKDLVAKSVQSYQASQKDVNESLEAELESSKVVVFMEGTPDAPKSEPSLNLVKMLTQVQAVPFVAVDVLAHPALLGYTVSKSTRERVPHVYVNGSFYADYEGMMAKYKTGELKKAFGTDSTRSKGVFGGELPVATY